MLDTSPSNLKCKARHFAENLHFRGGVKHFVYQPFCRDNGHEVAAILGKMELYLIFGLFWIVPIGTFKD